MYKTLTHTFLLALVTYSIDIFISVTLNSWYCSKSMGWIVWLTYMFTLVYRGVNYAVWEALSLHYLYSCLTDSFSLHKVRPMNHWFPWYTSIKSPHKTMMLLLGFSQANYARDPAISSPVMIPLKHLPLKKDRLLKYLAWTGVVFTLPSFFLLTHLLWNA